MRCDAPLQRVWAECRSPMRIFALLIALANDGLNTHTTHISHFSFFFFFWFVCVCLSCSTHKSTSRIHRNNPTTTRPVFALPQHAASHLSFVVHNLRQASTEKKIIRASNWYMRSIAMNWWKVHHRRERYIFQSTLKSGMLHTFGIVPDDKLTHSISDHTHNAPENRFIHAAAVIFCIFRLATDWRRPWCICMDAAATQRIKSFLLMFFLLFSFWFIIL